MDTDMDEVCAVCPRPGDLCGGCKDIYYCSHSHQKDDWPTHKLLCEKYARHPDETHPGKVWVIYFPVDGRNPVFRLTPFILWGAGLRWKYTDISSTECLQVSDVSSVSLYIGAPDQLDDPDSYDPEGLEVNRCIEALTGDTSWKGSVIAFAKDIYGNHVDMGTSHFYKVLKEFRSVVGVRINCDGLVYEHHRPRFEECVIESYDLQDKNFNLGQEFNVNRPIPLTLNIGIALQAKNEFHRSHTIYPDLNKDNTTARLMLIPCDADRFDFGVFSKAHTYGNVIVMREDRKPLDVQYVEDFCDWIMTRVQPLFTQAKRECKQLKTQDFSNFAYTREKREIRERALRRITERSFLTYRRDRMRAQNRRDMGDTQEEEMTDIIENEDTTDAEMPGRLRWIRAMDSDDIMSGN